LSQSDLVVAVHHRLPAQFPQVLGEVVNKRIVVVYYQYHFGFAPTTRLCPYCTVVDKFAFAVYSIPVVGLEAIPAGVSDRE
jgi:hypothetical protein